MKTKKLLREEIKKLKRKMNKQKQIIIRLKNINLKTLIDDIVPKDKIAIEERIQHIKELKNQGLTYEVIGKTFNLSRQRIFQILKKYE